MKLFFSVIIMSFFLFFVPKASAHTAHALQQFSDTSVVLLNYNVDHFHSGLPVTFIIQLMTIQGGNYIDFDEAEVTIKRFGVKQYSKTVKKGEHEDAEFKYTFPEGGIYTTDIEMVKDGKAIADASFSHRVDQWRNQSFTNFLFGNKIKSVLVLVVVCLGAYILGSIRVHHPLFSHVKKLRKKNP